MSEDKKDTSLEDLQKQLNSLKEELDSKNEKLEKLEEHNKILFKEAKDAKKAKADFEQELEDKKNKKNQEEGNLQAQLDSAMKKIEQLEENNNQTLSKWSEEKLSNAALDVAVKAGAEKHNAELLARFVKDRLVFDQGKVVVTDENGNHTISKLDELVKEVANNERYSSFITATKANGGGATTQNGGVKSENNTIKKEDFYQMSDVERQAYFDKNESFKFEE